MMNLPLIIGIICICVVILVLVITIILIKKKKPKSKIKVDESFIASLILAYGGKENIVSVSVDNARLKLEVKDLDLVQLDVLKANSEAGVFVTGNIIKTLFKLDSNLIKNSIEKKL